MSTGALRIKRVLRGLGIGPSELERRCGLSKTTWSRTLSGRLPLVPARRAELSRLLSERGLPTTEDLFTPDQDEAADGPSEVMMHAQHLSAAAKSAFHLFMNPFDPEAIIRRGPDGSTRPNELYLPPQHRFIEERIRQASLTAGFIALSGEPGSGKSTLLDSALRRAGENATVVRLSPANVERRKLSAAHISSEIIRQLSEEAVPRMASTRDAVAAEVLARRYEDGERVALVIDEAHELPQNTIKDLKRFHELRHGYAQLLAVILVGQTELAARLKSGNFRLREAIIRCQLISLGPMVGKVAEYMARRFDWVNADVTKVFEEDALDVLEAQLAAHDQQFPVLIGNAATAAMNVAAQRGEERVTDDDVDAVWSWTPEQLQELGR